MQAKHLTAMLAAAAATAHGARIRDVCFDWVVERQHKLGGLCSVMDFELVKWQMVLSKLDLNQCVGFNETDSEMIWKGNGDAFTDHCSFCSIPGPRLDEDTRQVILPAQKLSLHCQCVHNTTGEILDSFLDIEDHIYVDETGSLNC